MEKFQGSVPVPVQNKGSEYITVKHKNQTYILRKQKTIEEFVKSVQTATNVASISEIRYEYGRETITLRPGEPVMILAMKPSLG